MTVTSSCATCGFVSEWVPLGWISRQMGPDFVYFHATTCSSCWSSDITLTCNGEFETSLNGEFDVPLEWRERPMTRRRVVAASYDFIAAVGVELKIPTLIGGNFQIDIEALTDVIRVGNAHMVDDQANVTTVGLPATARLVVHRFDLDAQRVAALYEDHSFDESSRPKQLKIEFQRLPMGRRAQA